MKLTVIIPTRNDPLLKQTVESLRTGGMEPDIIVVDDCSDEPVTTEQLNYFNVHIVRNEHRLGPGPSRQKGAELVSSGWLMFSDSHMLYPASWHDHVQTWLRLADHHTVHGAVYRQNTLDNSFWHDTRLIGGADFYYWRHHDMRYSFIDLSPRRAQNRVCYDAACPLGGCYLISVDFFHDIGGFKPLIGYGSEETWLGWNAWLRGGRVEIMGNVTVTHITTPGVVTRRTMVPEWEINRLVVAKRILSDDEYASFCSWLPVNQTIKQHVDLIAENKNKYLSRNRDVIAHSHVEKHFNLQPFHEALELMMSYYGECKNACPVCANRRWVIVGTKFLPCRICNDPIKHQPKVRNHKLEAVV